MTKWKIYNEDAVEWARGYQKGKFHALLTDAPYHLTSIVKRFGKASMSDDTITSDKARRGVDSYSRLARGGFMGATWDGGDIAFRPETWEAFKEVLYPGAFGMAFSASRNWHRMAVAIEDAGFIIHPTMFFLWVQGQGFPKATRIEIKCVSCNGDGWNYKYGLTHDEVMQLCDMLSEDRDLEPEEYALGFRRVCDTCGGKGKIKNGHSLEGHRYGLQALKPSVEPIIVFQKPYEGKPLDNIVSTGAGALNIDGGRIPLATDDEYTINTFDDGAKPFGNGAGHKYSSKKVKAYIPNGKNKVYGTNMGGGVWNESSMGRWPTNLILDEVSADVLDHQTGTLVSGKPSGKKHAKNNIYGQYKNDDVDVQGFGDMGGASRFFYQVSTQLDEADPFLYQSKVSPKERNAGLDELEDIKMAVSGGAQGAKGRGNDEYLQDSIESNRIKVVKNSHPTLKPIALAKYLATLLLPPVEYAPRRIFIPFSGSGSEMVGCGLAGWEHVVGVEFDTENGYVDIAQKRLEHWLKGA